MSRTDWEKRYRTKDMPWEKGAPSPGLVDFLKKHRGQKLGSVCVPGCGTGHDVLAWAEAGFAATGFDIAPSAVRLGKARAKSRGVEAKFRLMNFLYARPPAKFDWVFEHTLFCAIEPQQRDDYVRAVRRWLKPGGNYLAVNYLIPDRDGPPFGTTRDEVWRRFSPYFELRDVWAPRTYPNRKGLELMFWWRMKRTDCC
jgi:cyclopropane fatty-acyl-phospholipid synthase-like methyltransferase